MVYLFTEDISVHFVYTKKVPSRTAGNVGMVE